MLTTVNDYKIGIPDSSNGSLIGYYEPRIVSANEYYPFGMLMRVGTTTTGQFYRYGFNGKENDWEAKGWMNQQDYGERVYDPRAGRFLSVDPLTRGYPILTPYQFSSNRPIDGIDQDGLEYSPASLNGPNSVARESTAMLRYPDHPAVIAREQKERANSMGVIKSWDGQPNFWGKMKAGLEMTKYSSPGSAGALLLYNIMDDAHITYTGMTRGKEYASRLDDSHGLSYKERVGAGLNTASLIFGGVEAIGERALISTVNEGAASFFGNKEFEALARTGVTDAKKIRFSQDNIAAQFKGGGGFEELINKLKSGQKVEIDPIRIVEKDGMVFTLDNRRLYVYQQAGVEVPYIKLDQIPKKELRKFTTPNNGTSIEIRPPKSKN